MDRLRRPSRLRLRRQQRARRRHDLRGRLRCDGAIRVPRHHADRHEPDAQRRRLHGREHRLPVHVLRPDRRCADGQQQRRHAVRPGHGHGWPHRLSQPEHAHAAGSADRPGDPAVLGRPAAGLSRRHRQRLRRNAGHGAESPLRHRVVQPSGQRDRRRLQHHVRSDPLRRQQPDPVPVPRRRLQQRDLRRRRGRDDRPQLRRDARDPLFVPRGDRRRRARRSCSRRRRRTRTPRLRCRRSTSAHRSSRSIRRASARRFRRARRQPTR